MAFGRSGKVPKTAPKGRKTGCRVGPPKYIAISAEVARLRDDEKVSFKEMARRFRVGESTISRAYDHSHPETVRIAANKGEIPKRGRYSHLAADKFQRIKLALAAGKSAIDIAADVACSINTVYREKRRLRAA